MRIDPDDNVFFALGNQISISDFLLSILGMKNTLNRFCWYVPFYAVVLLTMPLMHKVIRKTSLMVDGVIIILCFITPFACNPKWSVLVGGFISYYPVIIIGYYLAKYNVMNIILEKISVRLNRYPTLTLFVSIGALGGTILARYSINILSGWTIGVEFDGVFALLIIISVTLLFTCNIF